MHFINLQLFLNELIFQSINQRTNYIMCGDVWYDLVCVCVCVCVKLA